MVLGRTHKSAMRVVGSPRGDAANLFMIMGANMPVRVFGDLRIGNKPNLKFGWKGKFTL